MTRSLARQIAPVTEFAMLTADSVSAKIIGPDSPVTSQVSYQLIIWSRILFRLLFGGDYYALAKQIQIETNNEYKQTRPYTVEQVL